MDFQPSLRWLASNLPSPLVRQLRYRREAGFIRNPRSRGGGGKSVVFFTVRKCASTMMRRLLADIAHRHLGLLPLNLAAYLWDVTGEADVYNYLNAHARELFLERGILYAPLRRYVDVSHLREARVLAMLRDPRDVVVSAYYSARYSHRPPSNPERKARFQARRQDMAGMTFDDWIRREAVRTKEVYSSFRENLDRESVVTYEEMWTDFDAWLGRLGDCLNLSFSAAEHTRYRTLAGIGGRRTEDIRSHRRKGTPGDHVEKLTKPLVAELTKLFSDELHWLYR